MGRLSFLDCTRVDLPVFVPAFERLARHGIVGKGVQHWPEPVSEGRPFAERLLTQFGVAEPACFQETEPGWNELGPGGGASVLLVPQVAQADKESSRCSKSATTICS